MSLSVVGAPRSGILIGGPVPDADRWNAMLWLSGDQVAELPRTRNVWRLPSSFIRNRSEVLSASTPGIRRRLLSKTILPFPSGDSVGMESAFRLSVSRARRSRGPVQSVSIE